MIDNQDYILPAETKPGAVHLTVASLDRSLEFYQQVLGLHLFTRQGNQAALGSDGGENNSGIAFLELAENPAARQFPHTTGLYHFAILVPSRKDLARSLQRIVQQDWQPGGFADHGVSEAIYLADPEGNGIEIYRDRSRAEWPERNGRLHMTTDSLDIRSLLEEIHGENQPQAGIATGTVLGHMHLRVANIQASERFYCQVLGFQLIVRYGASASFVSAGGYHHHIGFNTWDSAGAPPPPKGASGLRDFTILLPGDAELSRLVEHIHQAGYPLQEEPEGLFVEDPTKNRILLASD